MSGTLLEHVFLSRVDPHLDASDDLLHFTVSKLACCDNGLFSRQYFTTWLTKRNAVKNVS